MASRNKPITSHSIFPLTLLYDGDCEVCAHEMNDLRGRDREKRLIFVDIAQPAFDPQRYGTQLSELRAQIHAVRPDGRLLRGVSVLHVAYAAVGRGWMFAPVKWPFLKPMANAVYRMLSKHRSVISRAVSPWLFGVWDRRARGTLQRMQDTCILTDDGVSTLPTHLGEAGPLSRAKAPSRVSMPVGHRGRLEEEEGDDVAIATSTRRARSESQQRSSLWQDTLPAINPPSRR